MRLAKLGDIGLGDLGLARIGRKASTYDEPVAA
jgi:hypothetical protein